MKVLGFVGSGRIEGNTNILVRQALTGAQEKGAETRIFHLNDMNIKGCQGCDFCKNNAGCIIMDDMQEIYKEITNAEAIIIGSPIYMMQLSAQTKLLIDRLYAFRNKDASTKIDRKKLMLVYVCRYEDPNAYKQYFDIMNSLLGFLGLFDIKDTITVGGTKGKEYIRSNSEVMQAVKMAGGQLVVDEV